MNRGAKLHTKLSEEEGGGGGGGRGEGGGGGGRRESNSWRCFAYYGSSAPRTSPGTHKQATATSYTFFFPFSF